MKVEGITVWAQGWLSVHDIGLEGLQVGQWVFFTNEVWKAHIKLREGLHALSWAWQGKCIDYSVAMGYVFQ